MKFLVSCLAITVPRAVLGSLQESILFLSQKAKNDADSAESSDDTIVPELHRCSSHHKTLAKSLKKSCEEARKSDDKSEKSKLYWQLHNMLGDEAVGMESLKKKWLKAVSDTENVIASSKQLAELLGQNKLRKMLETKSAKLQESLEVAKKVREKVDQENKQCLAISAEAFYDVVQQMRTCKKLYVKAKNTKKFKAFQEKCGSDEVLKEYEARNLASQTMFTECLDDVKSEYYNEDNVGVRVWALEALHDKCKNIQTKWVAKIAELAKSFRDDKITCTCESGPLKKMDRCQAKFFYKYNGDGEGLSDINRASIILPSVDGIIDAVKKVDNFFANNGGILRMKNRFMDAEKPHLDAGYSDILLNVKFEGIICEVQIHLQSLVNIKKGINEFGVKDLSTKGHAVYKVARRFSHFFLKVCFKGFNAKADDGTEDALDKAVEALGEPSLSRQSSFKDIAKVKDAFANLGMKKPERRRLMDRLACAEAYSC